MTASPPKLPRLARECRASFALAMPVVVGQVAAMGMNVVDTVLAGRHDAITLASVAVGSAIWSLVLLVAIGVLMAVPPSVSQLDGAGRRAEIGPLFRQALWLALGLGLVLLVGARSAEPLLLAVGIDATIRPGALAFLAGLSWGAPALTLYFACRYLSEGLHWSLPTLVFGLSGLALLVPLGYALLFGFAGLPALGAYGLGLATSIVLWLQVAGFVAYLALAPRFADLGLFGALEPPQAAPIGALLRLGLPMGVSVFMEGSLFVATALVIGAMGATAVAAHQIAINVASVAFMVPLGIAMATTVRVGHAVGRGDVPGLRWAAGAGYTLSLGSQTLSAIVMLAGAGLIAAAYTRDAEVAALAAALMVYAAAFQFSDGLQAASAGALRGLKDTRVPMVITTLAYWGVGIPTGWALGVGLGWGPRGMWWGLILGLSAAALLLTLRFWRLAARAGQPARP